MNKLLDAIKLWEAFFYKGCRVVLWSDGSGHVEARKVTGSNKWHPVFAFEYLREFLVSKPQDYYEE